MLVKTRAIVLHHIDYGETSILLYCYTKHYGRMAFIVNGVRSRKSSIPASYFQPLIVLDILFYHKENRNMFRLKELSYPVLYGSIPMDTSKSCIAMFVAEVLYRTIHEEECNTLLFEFCEQAIQVLDRQEEGTANFHLMFMLHFSKYLGIYPAGLLDADLPEMQADLQVFYDLPEKARKVVVQMLQGDWSTLSSIRLDGETRNLILDQLISFYQIHLQGMFNLKSLPVLKAIFH